MQPWLPAAQNARASRNPLPVRPRRLPIAIGRASPIVVRAIAVAAAPDAFDALSDELMEPIVAAVHADGGLASLGALLLASRRLQALCQPLADAKRMVRANLVPSTLRITSSIGRAHG